MSSNFDIDALFRVIRSKDIFLNYDYDEKFPLRETEVGFRDIFPELNEQFDFYFQGQINMLMNSMAFYSHMQIQAMVDEGSELIDQTSISDMLNSKIYNVKDCLVNFYDALIVNVNEWAHIKSSQPLTILSDDIVMKDIHRRISSPENLENLFDKTWDLYEVAIKVIPVSVALSDEYGEFNQLVSKFKGTKLNKDDVDTVKKAFPRFYFNSESYLDKEVVEMLGLFKEGYHDKLLEHKLDKYF